MGVGEQDDLVRLGPVARRRGWQGGSIGGWKLWVTHRIVAPVKKGALLSTRVIGSCSAFSHAADVRELQGIFGTDTNRQTTPPFGVSRCLFSLCQFTAGMNGEGE